MDFVISYLKQALGNGFKTGGKQVIEDLANGLSDENLGKLIEILVDVRKKKQAQSTVTVKQVR